MKEIKKTVRIDKNKYELITSIIKDKMNYSKFINLIIDDFINHDNKLKKFNSYNQYLLTNEALIKKTIYLNLNELQYINEVIQKNNTSFNYLVRKSIIAFISNKPILNSEEINGLNNLNKQLVKLGTNINFISRYYNTHKDNIELNSEQEKYLTNLLNITNTKLEEIKNLIFEIKSKCL